MKVYEIEIPNESKYREFYFNVNFNPSIIKSTSVDNLYIMSCHSFRRTSINKYKYPTKSININHPWYGGPESENWWYITPTGFRGTGFFLVYFDGNSFIIIDYLGLIDSIIDGRLFRLPDNDIMITGNSTFDDITIGGDRLKNELPGGYVNCKYNLCNLITKCRLRLIKTDDKFTLLKGKLEPLCANLSQKTEKNWSLWSYNSKVYISYLISPGNIIFTEDYDNERSLSEKTFIIRCNAMAEPQSNIFSDITKYYQGNVIFSLSTSALPFDENSYLSVGHAKIIWTSLDKNINTLASRFIKENLHMRHHPNMFYLMFFYTFDPITFTTLKISHAFWPPDTQYGVVFPSGLTMFDNDTFLISYGEGDLKMKCMLISKTEINSMLFNQRDIIKEDYQFIRL